MDYQSLHTKIKQDLKSSQFQADYYLSEAINFPKKYKMRYKKRKALKNKIATTFWNETVAKKVVKTLAVKKWPYLIKNLTYLYK